MGPSRGCPLVFTMWHLGSPGGSDPRGTAGPGQSHIAVYDLPHFRPLLLVTQSSAGTTGQGAVDRCEDQEVRITGGHLGGWLPSPRKGVLQALYRGCPPAGGRVASCPLTLRGSRLPPALWFSV